MRPIFFAAVVALAAACNPGVRVEVATKTLDYLSGVAVTLIEQNLKNVKIPDVRSSPGFFEYGVTNIVLDGLAVDKKDVSLDAVPGTGIRVNIKNANINLHGDYYYKLGIDHHTGDLGVQMSQYNMGLVLVLGMSVGSDGRGRAALKTEQCSAEVGSVSTHFSGGVWNSFVNLFRGLIDLILKPKMGELVCEQVQIDVDSKLDSTLRALSMEFDIMNGLMFDAALTRSPVVLADKMEVDVVGQTFLKSGTRPAYNPPILPASPATSNMFQLTASEDMLNSALRAVYDMGILAIQINHDMVEQLSPANAHYLNISCSDFMCLGAMLPTVNTKFGGAYLWIGLSAASAPNVSFEDSGVAQFNLDLNLDMRAQYPDKSLVPIFDVNLAVGIKASEMVLTTVNSTLYKLALNIDSTTPQTQLNSINVANVTEDNLQGLFQFAIGFGVGQANNTISQGINIAVDHNVMLKNTVMRVLEKAFYLAVDVAFALQ